MAHGDIQLENERFRVTQWTIEPGGAIPMHLHEYDYVVVPLVNDTMYVTNADGSETAAELVIGQSYSRSAGGEHTVANRGHEHDIVFVEIERLS